MKKYCWNCGAELDNDARICSNCGVRIQSVRKKCPYCGNAENEGNAVYCGNCGRKIDKSNRKIMIGIVSVILSIAAAAAVLVAIRLRAGEKKIIPEEPTVAESAAMEQAAEMSWTENILMSDEVANYIVYNGYGTFVMGSSVPRAQINSITFLDTLKDVPADSWDVSEKQDGSVLAWITNGNALYVGANGGINAKYCQSLFYGYYNVLEINFNHCFHTDYATSMKSMFDYCPSLRALDVSDFSTDNVTDMAGMFYQCSSLTSLDLSDFNTSKVTDMGNMFAYCDGLTNLDLSNFDTGNVVNHDDFMEPGKLVNGHPWEDLFALPEEQTEASAAEQQISENASTLSDDAKQALITFLENYELEYEDFIESYYYDGGAAVLADFDGDGIEELLLNREGSGDLDNDGYPDTVQECCVYDYSNGEWSICWGPETVGSISFAGYGGRGCAVHKDGKVFLAVQKFESPYGTGWGIGNLFIYKTVFYDSTYQILDTFEERYTYTGDINAPEVLAEYKINGESVTLDEFAQRICQYEEIQYRKDDTSESYFHFSCSKQTVEDLIRQLRQ